VVQRLGLRVRLAGNLRSATLGYAATPREKAADINGMFADDEVKAVFCAQGGDSANCCLPWLDWETIAAHPKIFLGISDITVLLNAIHVRTGLVTFHGDDVIWGFGKNATAYDLDEARGRLFEGRIGLVPASRERQTIRGGFAAGKLLGGNMRCLLKLAGTPFFPDLQGSILFLEALGITPLECHVMFHQLRQMGAFEKTRGVVIGYIDGLQRKKSPVQMEEVLLEVTADMDFPILKVNDFGHNCPNTVLPVGALAAMDADARTFEIREACVR
jgi:muramoyltetrapeptide carboxypeptidase